VTHLPAPDRQPTAPQAGQHPTVDENARRFLADLESAYKAQAAQTPTAIRIQDPAIPSYKDGPRIGATPPADQPGTRRPPMTQRAVDLNTTILSSSVFAAVLGGAATGVMWASGHANPTVVAWVCGCAVAVPAAFTLPVLALKGFMKSAKEVVQAAPPEVHQHFNGTVHQDNRQSHLHAQTAGLVAISRNELPTGRHS
jgi:hypothetical protein